MNKLLGKIGLVILCVASLGDAAVEKPVSGPQHEFENEIRAVVRNKDYYKAGRFEIDLVAGAMPYDSTIAHYSLGGRLNWHLSDHVSWEVLDAQMMFPSVTGFSTSLAQANGISNYQVLKIKQAFATNLMFSPVYAKVRFFGDSVLHMDFYLVVGGGLANTEVLKFASSGAGIAAVESVAKSGFDPMFDFGIGMRIFMNRAMGVVFDLRDYVVHSSLYGKKSLKSNYSVFLGLSFYLPTF